ncbi:response regulator transcription factor [Propionispora hippei]|uniref:DNA-binding response regulator, OmpR family, contains REC and winged-helix (WHTH) domain n=1 Tax=Propionispora hippei DSM 15287 TaxID=1123003 RepID=A0A1M6C1Y2_9FIRM|nr:response regulator transcription factor [Propionispora hippei]SHI54952.1 DNA-binding response regulator, OmpR family, contains REC and winged-helix (wHTH) domain [Propionispora hippei DSM 15287]
MRLLLVEDEVKLSEALSHLLKKNNFIVDTAEDGEKGLDMACTGIYDVIILDRMLPQQDGLALLKEFRELGYDTPVLFLTAKSSPEDRAQGLNAGADDYLVKPFFAVELVARLKALTRRKSKDLVKSTLVIGNLIFDSVRGQVIKNNEKIHLTVKESQLLELLIRNSGQVVTKERIMQKIWGYNSDTGMETINLYIHYLRKKLDLPDIKTVRGIGYYLQNSSATAKAAQ